MTQAIAAIDLEASAEVLRALAHAVRLDLLRAIVDGERAVSDIESVTGIAQPGLSQQLGILRKADLVATRREAKQVFYRINHARIAEVSGLLDAFVGTVGVPSGDPILTRLTARGGAAMFAQIRPHD